MKIAVCIKQVPDSAAKITAEGGTVTWGDAPLVINPWDEYAIEAALMLKEASDADVIALTIGGENAKDALKNALAMGCNEAVLISDPALANADSQAVARVLAAAIRNIGDVDVAFLGRQAIDSDMGVTAAQTARLLGWPMISLVSTLSLEGNKLRLERTAEEGRQVVETKLPVVITVSKDIGEPRLASFMGIRKAAKAVIPTWTLSDLAMGAPQPLVRWSEITNPPAREVKTEMITGSSPQEIAGQLADKILAEKVL